MCYCLYKKKFIKIVMLPFGGKKCSQQVNSIPRKHLCQSLFFNTVRGLRPATLLKKTLPPRAWWKSRTQSRNPWDSRDLRDPLELAKVMREKDFLGIITSFVYQFFSHKNFSILHCLSFGNS